MSICNKYRFAHRRAKKSTGSTAPACCEPLSNVRVDHIFLLCG